MHDENGYILLWRSLLSREPHLVLRIGTSLFAGATLAGFGMLGAWAWRQSTGGGYVDPEEMAIALSVASVAWIAALFCIWGRVRRARTIVRPSLLTIGIGIVTILGGVAIDELVRGDEEIVIGALALIAGGIVLLLWLSPILRMQQGKPVVDADNQVDVHCPSCGYSLIGLRDLRCPECGTRFTIDELIRAQHYSRPKPEHDSHEASDLPGKVIGRVAPPNAAPPPVPSDQALPPRQIESH